MADIDLPSSGKDTRWTITLDGVPVDAQEIISVQVTPNYDEIMTKPLGREGSLIDQEFSHYELQVEVKVSNYAVDSFEDSLEEARAARTAKKINLTGVTTYRDGTTRTYVYADCKLTASRTSVRRGESVTKSLTFKCGSSRVTS